MNIDEIKNKEDIELWIEDKLYESMPIGSIIKCADRHLEKTEADYVVKLLKKNKYTNCIHFKYCAFRERGYCPINCIDYED